MPMTSGFYKNIVVGALRPAAQIERWGRDNINPSGFRHHESGQYRPSAKIQIALVGGFQAQKESGVALDYGSVIIPEVIPPSSIFMTDTNVFTFNLGEVNSNKDSFFNKMVDDKSVGQNFKAFNMRLWIGTLQAFPPAAQPTMYFKTSAEWRRGYQLIPGDSGVQQIPFSMPNPNIFAKAPSSVFASGNFLENEFSHFIYTRGVFTSGTYILGTFGGLGSGTFTLRFTYDWTEIMARVLPTDL